MEKNNPKIMVSKKPGAVAQMSPKYSKKHNFENHYLKNEKSIRPILGA
jgi:hypothetical protein